MRHTCDEEAKVGLTVKFVLVSVSCSHSALVQKCKMTSTAILDSFPVACRSATFRQLVSRLKRKWKKRKRTKKEKEKNQ